MNLKNKTFGTSLVCLQNLEEYNFVIPSYQRPYVWGDVEIIKLLGVFHTTFQLNKENNYYIGSILTNDVGYTSELIDGQQRFTTLWLTAFVFWTKNSNSDITKLLLTADKQLKMSFEIRTEVREYLESLIENKEYNDDIVSKTSNHPYLEYIARALTTIKSFIDVVVSDSELTDFGNYIYHRVCFIKNETPNNLDLNKLFSTVNSAGVQLEQTDIVKSNLLNLIDEKVMYGKIWEACENMNDYFERNVRVSFPKTNWNTINLTQYIPFNEEIFLYDSGNDLDVNESFTIDKVDIDSLEAYTESKLNNFDENKESDEVYCRSILNFGQLLLHTYRLFLREKELPDFEGSLHVNRLIEIFNNLTDPEHIKDFIKKLWEVRFLFDKYVIKWVSDSNSKIENLELLSISRNSDSYYSRTAYEKKPSSLMIQSVLYFTGDHYRQYWLTPFLYKLSKIENDTSANNDIVLNIIENIDNQLSLCTTMIDKDATFRMLDDDLDVDFNFENYLNEFKGTKFKHYWFHKLEYVLWKNWNDEDKTDEFKNYRIVSRNSVEHIYPQKDAQIDYEHLHSFGNLVLLSVSQNSEYGAKPVSVKRSMFLEKRNTYDSLKSYVIFKNYPNWNEDSIDKHKDNMIKLLLNYYNIGSNESL
jgi:uncharacterized protein with ParB-like and HNH nuclease domain